MWTYYNKTISYLNTLNEQEWLILLALVVVVGVVCLRGFGSRAGY